MEENKSKKDLILKTLFIIGVVAIIIVFAYAVIKIVPKVFSSFASVGQIISSPFKSNSIQVEVNNSSLSSGDQARISWNYEAKELGDYTISYTCEDSLSIQLLTNDGEKTLLCNTPYNLEEKTSADLEFNLKKENLFVDVPFTIQYIDSSDKVIASGEINITVKSEAERTPGGAVIISEPVDDTVDTDSSTSTPRSTTSPKPTNTNTGSTYSSTPYNPYVGNADLAISNIVALGDLTISFTISNIGGKSTGSWYFSYTIPGGNVEVSPVQPNLAPGQGIRYTLTLDNTADSGNVVIVADSYNTVTESNNSNNAATIKIKGGNGTGSSVDNDYNKNDDADLDVVEFEIGRLSGSKFTEDDEIDEDDEAAVRFIVKNIGGESTGSWRYEITNLPYDNGDDEYRSGNQTTLRPGESREYIVGFDSPDEGNYTIHLEVDSDDDVDEEKENNNSDSDRLEVSN